MAKVAVVIGVDRAGNLPVLQGASLGAERFAAWASSQGFKTVLRTDAGGQQVTVAEIKKIIRELVDPPTLQQLIVHFSGHGILTAPNCELWLLSGAPDEDEAIDVARSIWLARDSGIAHVVFISDACRTTSNPLDLAQLDGRSIFPNSATRPRRSPRSEVDQFYATLPGDTALEVAQKGASGHYSSVFNDCLLDGLKFPGSDLVDEIVVEGTPTHVVPSWHLKTYLLREVPRAASRVHISLQQDPDAMVESHPPRYLSRVPDSLMPEDVATPPAGPVGGGSVPPQEPSSRTILNDLKDEYYLGKTPPKSGKDPRALREPAILDAIARLRHAQGRLSFETRTGFSVVGTTIASADVSDGSCDVFAENSPSGPNHVRVYPTARPTSALIQFPNGTGTCLAVIPDFIGTVVVEGGAVVSVNYTPSRGTPRYPDYEAFRERIEARRAFVAVAARNGVFRIDQDEAAHYGDFLRRYKSIDPTLGLYAAYAFAQVGMLDKIESIAEYMRQDGLPALFDVALLGRALRETEIDALTPLAPMLTQGWRLLETSDVHGAGDYRDARRQLLPSLWTTLTAKGMGLMKAKLRAAVTA